MISTPCFQFQKLALSEKLLFLSPAVMFLIVVLGVVSAFFPRRLCIPNTYRSISHNATTRSNRPFCRLCFSLEYYEQTLRVTGCIWKPTACQDKHGLWSQEAERTQWLNIIYWCDKKKKVSFYWQDWHRLRKWADYLESKHFQRWWSRKHLCEGTRI